MQGHFSPVQLPATPWTLAHQAPLSMMDSPGKNTGVGCHTLLQGIFPTQGTNPCLMCLPPRAGRFFTTRVIWKALAKVNLKLFIWQVFLTSFLILIPHVKRTDFAFSKKKQIHLNQFSPESKQYHGHPVSNKLSFLSIVIPIWLKYRSNSAQIDCDNRARRTDNNLGTSCQGDGGLWSEDSKGVNKLARVGKPGLPAPLRNRGR